MVDLHTGVLYDDVKVVRQRRSLLTFGEKLDAFIWRNLHLQPDDEVVKVLATATQLNLELLEDGSCSCIINLKRINDVRHISPFLQTVNAKLPKNGFYITRVETKNQRISHIMNRFPWPLNWLFIFVDFMFHRVMPKFPFIRRLYFWATKGHNRALTLSETLGRLISCGFAIMDHKEIDGYTWIAARKEQLPRVGDKPTFGMLVKLRRVGMHGKLINVYKLRTMHPFSEYIQEYVYLNNNLKEGGKLENDFRITSWGRVLRKLWIDELPMIWNLLKGEMKPVGVRPLSQHYFHLYPEEVQRLRISTRPGLVPPFYADLPKTFDEIVESERRYLLAYKKQPLRTDIRYFFMAMGNILIKRARSS